MEELSLRPHASPPTLLKPKTMPPPGAQLQQNNHHHLHHNSLNITNLSPLQVSPLQAVSVKSTASAPLPIVKSDGKPKTASKAEFQQKVDQILEDTTTDVSNVKQQFDKLQIPGRYVNDILVAVALDALKKDTASMDILEQLLTDNAPNCVGDTLSTIMRKLPSSDGGVQKAALLVAHFVLNGGLELNDAAQWTDVSIGDENTTPWIVWVLKAIVDKVGEHELVKMCHGVNLIPHMSPAHRHRDGLAAMLDRHGLNCLQPLHIRLERQLSQVFGSIDAFESTINELDDTTKQSHEFVLALVTVVMRAAYHASADEEKEIMMPYKLLLQRYCFKRNGMWALYAVQELWAKMNCPKGILLRWFNTLYEEEIVDEEEFLRWKEDVNDEFAGKGKALFQVNNWLTWLQEAEEEDEEAE